MSQKTNITSRAIFVLFAFFLFPFFFTASSVYADGDFDFSDSRASGVYYGSNSGTATWDLDTRTLTLNGYDGGPISSIYTSINIVLLGENTITGTGGHAIEAYHGEALDISGDGSLNVINGYIAGDGINISNTSINIRNGEIRNYRESSAHGGISISNSSISIINQQSDYNFAMYINPYGDSSCDNDHCRITLDHSTINIETTGSGFFTGESSNGKGLLGEIIIDDSTINITAEDSSIDSQSIYMKSGTVDATNAKRIKTRYFLMDGGVFTANRIRGDGGYCAFVLNNGQLSLSEVTADKGVFNQNSGELIISNENAQAEDPAFAFNVAVFNGGKANISINSKYMPAIMTDKRVYEIDPQDLDLSRVGAVRSKSGSALEFNGGDVTATGGMAAIISNNTGIFISDDMLVEPTIAKLAKFDLAGDEATTFTDGEDPVLDMQNMAIHHALQTVHIYKASIPVPPADGGKGSAGEPEENPNTLDTRIIALAFGVLFAIIAEGIIIADLHHRIFGIKKEAAELGITTDETTPEQES